jgi:hypothetical protein
MAFAIYFALPRFHLPPLMLTFSSLPRARRRDTRTHAVRLCRADVD